LKERFSSLWCRYLISLTCALAVSACAGRTANPIAEHSPSDRDLTCVDIRIQQTAIDNEVRALVPKTDKTAHNVALGAAGFFTVGIAWFWLDLSKSEQIEIDAYRRRYQVLQELKRDKHCDAVDIPSGALPIESSAVVAP
jgi:hypothetical protein